MTCTVRGVRIKNFNDGRIILKIQRTVSFQCCNQIYSSQRTSPISPNHTNV